MLVLAATLAIQALTSMAVLMPAVYVGVAAPEIGVDPARIGAFMAVIYLAAAAATASCGGWIRRRGALRVSQLGLVATALGLALYVTAVPALVLAGGIIAGFGLGPITPSSAHLLIRRTPPHRRALVFSLRQTGVPLGNALAGAIVPPLVLMLGWRGTTVAMAVLCLALAVGVQPLHAELDADADPQARGAQGLGGAYGTVLRTPMLLRLALGSIGFSAMQACFAAFVVTFLTTQNGIDLAVAGLVLSVSQVTAMGARIFWGWVADRFVAPRVLLCLLGLGMAASGAVFALVTAAWPIALVAAVTVMVGATAMGWNGVLIAEVARLAPPGAVGSATGASLSFTFLGAVAAPPVFSAIVAGAGGYRVAFIAAALCAGLAGLALGRSTRSG
jgi:MFS family permease